MSNKKIPKKSSSKKNIAKGTNKNTKTLKPKRLVAIFLAFLFLL